MRNGVGPGRRRSKTSRRRPELPGWRATSSTASSSSSRSSDVDVDQLVAKLERATAIVDELDRRIRRTRAQVEELVPKLEAVGRAVEPEQSTARDAPDSDRGPGADDGAPVARAGGSESDRDTLPF